MKKPLLVAGTLLWCLNPLLYAQEAAYLAPLDGYAGGSEWNAEDDPNETDWNHDNGSDQWEGELGIEGGMPGGVELLEQDGANFIRIQDARTAGGTGDNRKIMFTKTVFEEGDDPLEEDADGITIHCRIRLASPLQGLPLEEVFEGDAWPDEGDGTRVRFGGKGSFGIDTAVGTFGFGLGRGDGDEALVNADGDPVDGLIVNGAEMSDGDGNVIEITEPLTDWQEFWIHIVPDASQEPSTHKVAVFKNGSLDGAEFFVTPGTGNVGGAPEPALYFGHAGTDQIGAYDIDFFHVVSGLVEPLPTMGSDPNLIWSRRSDLGQVATVPSAHEGSVTLRNNGDTKALTLSNFAVAGADADHWTINESPTTIAAVDGTAELRYTFDSKGNTGAFNASITFDTDDPDTPNATITLSASVINPAGPGGQYPLDDLANAEMPTIADVTGHGRPGSYSGNVTLGQGAIVSGTAATVTDGGVITVPARPLGDLTNYTTTFWLNLSALPNDQPGLGALMSRAAESDNNPAVSLLVAGDGALWWLVPDAQSDPLFVTETKLEVGTDYHLAVVAEGNHDQVSIYLNGALIGSGEGLGEASPSEAGLYFFGSFGPLSSTGTYDDLQIYTRALSAADVASLASSPGSVIMPEGPPDDDQDGLTNEEELALGTDPLEEDTDGDGLTDFAEDREHMTNPLSSDSDGDGREDAAEVAAGSDPNDALSPPPPPQGSLIGNLVAHWTLDESDGAVVADSVGSHEGAVMGTAEWRPDEGKVGGALFFDGSDGFIEVPDSEDFEFGEDQSWTASLWYKTDAVEDDQGLITKGYADDSRAETGYWQMQTRGGGFALDSRCCAGGDPRARIDSSSGISHGDGEWHHFVVARDGALQEIRLYVDGQLTTTDVSGTDNGLWAMGANDDPLVIANHFNRFTVWWFDDIAIWNGYALTDADVAAIAEGGVGAVVDRQPSQGGPVALSIEEMGLGGDEPAQIVDAGEGGYDEDTLTFSDRTHEHNSAEFDADGVLTTAGGTVAPLPAYLVGSSYVQFANNARDQDDYSATVTADKLSNWYLLLDNRIDGPAGSTGSPNTEDPVLGGSFQWVLDAGWQRVNTGISPNGQADFVGVDEGGDGGLNQFYSVWTLPVPSMSVTVRNNGVGGSNMISLVASAAGSDEGRERFFFENVGLNAEGAFGVTLPEGITADIEYSIDLINWVVIATEVTGAVNETDAGRLAAPVGYYRAIQ